MIVSSDFRSPRDMMPEPRGGGNPFEGRPDMEASYMMRFFIVRVEESGDATYISTDFVASIDADTAVEYANKALSKRSDEGYIGNYRYAKIDNSGETVLIFLNASRELQFGQYVPSKITSSSKSSSSLTPATNSKPLSRPSPQVST